MAVVVEVHRGSDWPDLGALVADGEADGQRLVAVAREEWLRGANRFDREKEAFLIARDAGVPIGICGLNVDPYLGDDSVARLRHLYVLTSQRRRGIGGRLVRVCVDTARSGFRRIRLRTFDPVASAFYESVGFTPVSEDDATHAIEFDS